MGYLDTLKEIEDNVSASGIPANHKIILVGLIDRERSFTTANEDAFVYFYKNVLQSEDVFNYSDILDEYGQAKGHANICVTIFLDFISIEGDQRLHTWLQSAIRFVDCIAIHYIQEVLQEESACQDNVGAERSRYKQINRKDVKAQKAGSIMDNLYKLRSKMEHVTRPDKDNPTKKVLVPPKYNKIRKKILETFPDALDSFNVAYKEHYTN